MTSLMDGLVLSSETADFRKVKRARKNDNQVKSVDVGSEEQYEAQGWTVSKSYIKKTHLIRPKAPDWQFEDEVWLLLADLGFNEMNRDREFRIPITKNETSTKQIDVYAMEEDVVLIVECKYSEALDGKPVRRQLRSPIQEMSDNRNMLTNYIRKHYGRKNGLRVEYVLATRGIQWSKNDLAMAEEKHIHVLRDDDLNYFSDMAKHLDVYARYQFFAELFGDRAIKGLSNIKVSAIRTPFRDKGKKAYRYTFHIDPKLLIKLAYVSHRARGKAARSLKSDRKPGYQRMIKKARLNKVRKYVADGGHFPNSVVVNFISAKKKKLKFQPSSGQDNHAQSKVGTLTLPNNYRSAWIIDGQHRLYGYTNLDRLVEQDQARAKTDDPIIPVSAYDGLDANTAGIMFVDINSKQQKVSANILNSDYADLLWDSDSAVDQLYALSSQLALKLNDDTTSPMFDLIKADDSSRKQPLTLYTIADAIRKRNLFGKVGRSNDIDKGWLYAADGKGFMDASLERGYRILCTYFGILADKAEEHWMHLDGPKGFLCSNQGVGAMFMVLQYLLLHIQESNGYAHQHDTDEDIIKNSLSTLMEPIVKHFKTASDATIMQYKRQYGLAGQRSTSWLLLAIVQDSYVNFKPKGLEGGLAKIEDERHKAATLLVQDLEKYIREIVLVDLEDNFGSDYMTEREAVPKGVFEKSAHRLGRDVQRVHLSTGLDLIDYNTIATRKTECALKMREKLGDGTLSERQHKSSVDWIVKLNEIRKKTAHVKAEKVTVDEMNWLKGYQERFL
jgi:DNA sulfur modification protein DndB